MACNITTIYPMPNGWLVIKGNNAWEIIQAEQGYTTKLVNKERYTSWVSRIEGIVQISQEDLPVPVQKIVSEL